VPYVTERPRRIFGRMRGEVRILPGFDELDEEIVRDFEDSVLFPRDA
jgi:hypothetical protein